MKRVFLQRLIVIVFSKFLLVVYLVLNNLISGYKNIKMHLYAPHSLLHCITCILHLYFIDDCQGQLAANYD